MKAISEMSIEELRAMVPNQAALTDQQIREGCEAADKLAQLVVSVYRGRMAHQRESR